MIRIKIAIICLTLIFLGVLPRAQSATLEEMCSPKLRKFLEEHPTASTVLSNAFSAAFSNRYVQIYYFYVNETNVAKAYHYYPGEKAVVIACEETLSPCDEYFAILFETFNSENESSFLDLQRQAQAGNLTKSNYTRAVLKLEFTAVQRTKKLLGEVKLSDKEIAESSDLKKLTDCPDNFEGFLAFIKPRDAAGRDPVKHYEIQYDELRKHQTSSRMSE